LEREKEELTKWSSAERTYIYLQELHQQAEHQNGIVIGYSQYESLLVKFRTIVQELASQAMEATIDSINTTCNNILHDIFESGIQVLLKTHRELKSKDLTKLQVNLQVAYRGNTYDSPLRLSGGEQDRISMALTLAVAKVSSSPIIMLDECMAALDEDLREQCLETIEKFFPSKTILHVCHGAVKGQHHRVLRL
jgi:ABC-type thiamine transport system ATPase subunit